MKFAVGVVFGTDPKHSIGGKEWKKTEDNSRNAARARRRCLAGT